MSDFLQEKRKAVIFIGIILFLLLGLAYYYFILPLKDEEAAAEQNMTQLEMDVKTLESQLNQDDGKKVENTTKLEKEVPLTRNLDDLLLSLQEIEMVTGSRIDSITFNNYDNGLSETDETIEKEKTTDEDKVKSEKETESQSKENSNGKESVKSESDSDSGDAENTETPESDLASNGNLPTNIKLITLNMSVISPDYDHFRQFLQELEKLERITRVDKLNFTQPAERELLYEKNGSKMITTEVQITTFYYDE